MEEKIKCLYYIKDNRTDKIIYIGQTIDFKSRVHSHHYDKRRAIDSYMINEGKDNFSIEPFDIDVSDYTEDEMRNKEDELIVFYNTIEEGLNRYRSGNFKHNKKEYHTEQMKEYRKTQKYKEWKQSYKEKANENSKRCILKKKERQEKGHH